MFFVFFLCLEEIKEKASRDEASVARSSPSVYDMSYRSIGRA